MASSNYHAAKVIEAWMLEYTSDSQTFVDAILALLDVSFLLSIPLPSKAYPIPLQPENKELCSFFYRHAANILGWRKREKFDEEVYKVLREEGWRDPSTTSNNGEKRILMSTVEGKLLQTQVFAISKLKLMFSSRTYARREQKANEL